jgi:hypothetical protein
MMNTLFALGPAGKLTDELRPLLFTTNIKKAKDFGCATQK